MLSKLLMVGMPMVDNPDDPTGGNPDALVIEGERIEPDDVSIQGDLDDDDGTPEVDPDKSQSQGGDGDVYKKRFGDATRALQEKDRDFKALKDRIDRLEKAGVNLSEIEALIPDDSPTAQAQNPNLVTKDDLNRLANNFAFSMAKTTFISNNPEFRDPNLSGLLDYGIITVANEDRQRGEPARNPDDLILEASKKVKSIVSSFESKGGKKATQTRQKIKSQAADMGGDTGKKGKSDEDEEDYDSRGSYMEMSRTRTY